jgi:Asp-tRNA(Asn)/Glu-tRNA(Gln) amidotransferase B subunit
MIDANELMRRLDMQGNSPQAKEAISRLQRAMQSGKKGQAQAIDSATAARIERAAKAAQAGDKRAAQAAIGEIMSTPQGAALAAQLKNLLGK